MKSSDWILLIVVGAISAGLAVWLSNLILGDPDEAKYTIKTSSAVTSTLDDPNVDVFNINAINPTVDVYVGSCQDLDGDGIINSAEARACNAIND